MNPQDHPVGFLATLAAIGAAIGIGKLLSSNEAITPRLIIGRAIVSGGLGAVAGAGTIMFPEASPIVLYGLSALLASLGTSALEAVFKKKIGGSE